MEVIIRETAEQASALVAEIVARSIRARPSLVLGLATGRTMEHLYDELVRMHEAGEVDFSLVKTFNLDEYIGLPPEDKNSYLSYMNRQLFNRVNIDPRNTFLPNGMAENIEEECEQYERNIVESGGIDLQILGIGRSGHIGVNDPLSAMRSRTRAKALSPQTIEQNAPFFGGPENMPKRAITMGD